MKTGHSFVFSLVALVPALCGSAAPADKVDDYVQGQIEKRHIPGLSLAVVRDGQVLLAKGYGLANAELSVPATGATIYQIGSITKQFTASAIMMLVEEEKLAVNDPIANHLPDLPEAWSAVTVKHLLNHTSGIKSYTGVLANLKAFRTELSKEEILKTVRDLPLEFEPGQKWAYNNTGYFLLGMIIESVSGKPYGEFLDERIFKPLDMVATRVNDQRDVIPNRAAGYAWERNTLRNGDYSSMSWPYSAGALVSTVSDLARWDAALYSERVLRRSSLDEMWTPTPLEDGKTVDYGFGWGVGSLRGHRHISHGGGISGFSTYIARFVDDRLTVIVLTNLESANPTTIAHGVAAFHLADLAEGDKPIEDKSPETTEMFKKILASTVEGTLDPESFTPEMRADLFPDKVKSAGEFLKTLGDLGALALIEASEEGKKRVYRYRVTYGETTLVLTGVLNEEGKIAGLLIRPD